MASTIRTLANRNFSNKAMQTAKRGQRFSLDWGLLRTPGCRLPQPLTLSLAGMIMGTQAMVLLPAQAAVLSSWNFDSKNTQLEFMVQQGTQPNISVLNQPPRIVLDLPNTELGVKPSQKTYSGSVRQIEVAQIQGETTRIVMEFDPNVVLDPSQVRLQRVSAPIENGPFRDRWVLRSFVTTAPTGSGGWQASSPLPATNYNTPQTVSTGSGGWQASSPLPVTNYNTSQTVSTGSGGWQSASPLPPTTYSTPQFVSIGTGGWQAASPLPPATYTPPPSATVSVPPLTQTNFPRPTATTATGEFGQSLPLAAQLPPSNPLGTLPLALPTETSPIPAPSETVVVPALERPSAVGVTKLGAANPAPVAYRPRRGNEILLPAGTQLFLRYAGEKIVKFHPDLDKQEVLFLDAAIFDNVGNLIVPEGTPIIGRFESNRKGSRFVAQAITLAGRNIPLSAQSERFEKSTLLRPGETMEIRLKEALR